MTLVGGRACVVSGAGRGLGRGIADLFARQGAALALCARGERELQTAADDLRRQHGVEILTAALDVRDAAAVRDFARATEREIGAAYGLVNNAAALGPVGRIDEVDLGDWKRAFEANVVGVANMCAAFAPQMAGAGGGVILNLSGGGIGGPSVPDRVSAYTTAKAGVVMLTETLARELAPSAIRVNAIAPGSQPTGFLRPVLDAGPGAVGDDLYRTAAAMADGPSGEVQDVDDRLAELVVFLLSEESSWLSGRLVSARWDSVERLRAVEKQLRDSSFLTLRRIDGELFRQVDERG